MADGLTQLQDSLDQLATQMFASLRYISAHHSLAPIPNQPFHGSPEPAAPTSTAANHASPTDAPPTQQQSQSQSQPQTQDPLSQRGEPDDTQPQQSQQQQQQQEQEDWDPNAPPRPDTPRTFAAALDELAQDLVKKEQQIEALVAALPGRGRSREEQEARLQELDAELRGVESEVAEAARERDELRERVEHVMWKVRRW